MTKFVRNGVRARRSNSGHSRSSLNPHKCAAHNTNDEIRAHSHLAGRVGISALILYEKKLYRGNNREQHEGTRQHPAHNHSC